MNYLPEDCIIHIMSFFERYIYFSNNKKIPYQPIEIIFLSLTSKDFNTIVKKFFNVKKLSCTNQSIANENYYYSSIQNIQMIKELRTLNMITIPYCNVYDFFFKLSKNVKLLHYFNENPIYGFINNNVLTYVYVRQKIRFYDKTCVFLITQIFI